MMMMTRTNRNSLEEVASTSTEPALYRVSSSDKSKESGGSINDSLLKRAIRENENSIIQSILSPTALTSSSSNNDNDTGVNVDVTGIVGLSPLLDYLYEDGQLTRIEYDFVDKGYGGVKSDSEQVQMLLKILLETKDDEALEILLEYLYKLNPSSETIQKLRLKFQEQEIKNRSGPTVFHNNTHTTVFGMKGAREVIEASQSLSLENIKKRNGWMNSEANNDHHTTREKFKNSPVSCENSTRPLYWDFYYGRSQLGYSFEDNGRLVGRGGFQYNRRKYETQQQSNKRNNMSNDKASIDSRDFYLTNGCLETTCNLILSRDHKRSCRETLTASGWERVLRNMNGLLSTDVLSIKELLFHHQQLSWTDHIETELEMENGIKKEVEPVKRINLAEKEGKKIHHENGLKQESRWEEKGASNDHLASHTAQDEDIKFPDIGTLNWNQIIYHSLQVWKLRNGRYSTFFSLLGVFQHSRLYGTSDFLLEKKMEIQARENEKASSMPVTRITDGIGSKQAANVTMLEKSDFLRKFYSPTRHSKVGSDIANSLLSTANDRVCVSPVLSLDLLL